MVEKVPDSTYEMVGGLDKQIKEIKEVIELPVKHPELFEALGIAQPKVFLKDYSIYFLYPRLKHKPRIAKIPRFMKVDNGEIDNQ